MFFQAGRFALVERTSDDRPFVLGIFGTEAAALGAFGRLNAGAGVIVNLDSLVVTEIVDERGALDQGAQTNYIAAAREAFELVELGHGC